MPSFKRYGKVQQEFKTLAIDFYNLLHILKRINKDKENLVIFKMNTDEKFGNWEITFKRINDG